MELMLFSLMVVVVRHARGGGKTHKFYASMGQNISNEEIQLTIQGQTVSSNFGTVDSAQFNMEQLIKCRHFQ